MDALAFDETRAIQDAKRGKREAFGELVRAYQRKAYAVAYGFVGNREDALELAQDAFAKAYKAMARFDTELPFYPWLYRIIRNTCLNHLKKRRRRREISLDSMTEAGFDPRTGDNPERHAIRADLRRAILAAMSELSERHREILMLRHFQELSYAEIAQCLGVPAGTVMSRLHTARQKLREQLRAMGVIE